MTKPFVSVVIPVRNNPNGIEDTLTALQSQTYSKDLFEIIVVDNGSTDNTKEIIKRFPVKLLEEKEYINPYIARNKGIENAKGEIIAFTDSDCIPANDWIEEGVKALSKKEADLIGGKIVFTYSKRRTLAECIDSIVFLQQESLVRYRNSACTANLFVRRKVFDKIGAFSSTGISGNDVRLTNLAVQKGYKLDYADSAEVFHKARKLIELIKKVFRTGRGKGVGIRHGEKKSGAKFEFESTIKKPLLISVLNPSTLHKKMKAVKDNLNIINFLWSLLICYMLAAIGVFGVFWGFLIS